MTSLIKKNSSAEIDLYCLKNGTSNLVFIDADIKGQDTNREVNCAKKQNSIIISSSKCIKKCQSEFSRDRPVSENFIHLKSFDGKSVTKYEIGRKNNLPGNINPDPAQRVLSQIVMSQDTLKKMDEGYNVSIILEDYTSKNSGIHSYDPETLSNNIGIDLKSFFKKYDLLNKNLDNFKIYVTMTNEDIFYKKKIMDLFLKNIAETIIDDIKEYGVSKTFYVPGFTMDMDKDFLINQIFNIIKDYYCKIININYNMDEVVSVLADKLFGSYIGYDLNNISTSYTINFGDDEVEFAKVGDNNYSRISGNNRKNSIEIVSKNVKKFYLIVLLKCKGDLICDFYENDGSKLNTNIKELTEEYLPNIKCQQLFTVIEDINFYNELNNVKLKDYKDYSELLNNKIKDRREGKRDSELVIRYNSGFNNWENDVHKISNDINDRIFVEIEEKTNKSYADYSNDIIDSKHSLPHSLPTRGLNSNRPWLGRATSVAMNHH